MSFVSSRIDIRNECKVCVFADRRNDQQHTNGIDERMSTVVESLRILECRSDASSTCHADRSECIDTTFEYRFDRRFDVFLLRCVEKQRDVAIDNELERYQPTDTFMCGL